MSRKDDEFTAFVDRARPTLLRTAWLLTGVAGEAEELVQEALVRTYVAWPRVRPDTATAYARTIVARLHVDQGRRSAREQVRDVVPERGATDAYREDRPSACCADVRLGNARWSFFGPDPPPSSDGQGRTMPRWVGSASRASRTSGAVVHAPRPCGLPVP